MPKKYIAVKVSLADVKQLAKLITQKAKAGYDLAFAEEGYLIFVFVGKKAIKEKRFKLEEL